MFPCGLHEGRNASASGASPDRAASARAVRHMTLQQEGGGSFSLMLNIE